MKKITIVSFYGSNPVGGVERVVSYLERALPSIADIEILSGDNGLKNSMKLCYSIFGKKLGVVLLSCIASLVVGLKKTFVVSHGYFTFLFPAEIVFAHGNARALYQEMVYRGFVKKKPFHIFSCIEKIAMKKAKKVIAVSGQVKKDLIRYYRIPDYKIYVILNAIDTDVFRVNDKLFSRTVLFVGRIESAKGIRELEKLIRDTAHSEWKVLIASPDVFSTTRLSIFPHVTITTCSTPEEMAELYMRSAVLFFPSYYEGFSLSALEALSCGVPILGKYIGEKYMTELPVLVPKSIVSFDEDADSIQQLENIYQIYTTSERMQLAEMCRVHFSLDRFTRELLDII